jgi:hypothetical protein
MRVRDLFVVFLKLLGIYILAINLESIIAYTPVYVYERDYFYLLLAIGGLLAVTALVYVLFRYSDVILKYVLPEKGLTSTTINFDQINKTSLLEIGIIIVSFSLIVRSLQSLILQGFYFFKREVEDQGLLGILDSSQGLLYNKFSVREAIVSVILGLILIALRKSIVKLF